MLLMLQAPTLAQDSGQVRPGARVRVYHHCAEKYDPGDRTERVQCEQETGTLESVDSDSVVIDVNNGGSLAAIPLGHISRFQVSGGRGGAGARGAAYGALGGALGGALFGIVLCNSTEGSTNSPGACALGGALAIAIPGALLGLILGNAIGQESWIDVPVEGVGVSLAPAAGGVGVGISVQF
jgi:hypothetical protein